MTRVSLAFVVICVAAGCEKSPPAPAPLPASKPAVVPPEVENDPATAAKIHQSRNPRR